MDQVKIGLFISELRKEKGVTQAELAEYMGVSNRAVSKWEHGQNLPDAGRLLPLCDYFDITVNEFLCGERINMSNVSNYQEKAEKNLVQLQNIAGHLEKMKNVVVTFDLIVNVLILLSAICNYILIYHSLKGHSTGFDELSNVSVFPAPFFEFILIFLIFDIDYFLQTKRGKPADIAGNFVTVSIVAKLFVLIIILVISCALGIPQFVNMI